MVLLTTLTYLFAMMVILPFLYLLVIIIADIGKKIKYKVVRNRTDKEE